MAAIRLTLVQARHAWLARQGLAGDAPRTRSLVETIGDIGWIPLGSPVTPYLALFARQAITQRSELDEVACKRAELSVVPGPRGSSWLVPVADAPVARAFGVADHASREARIAAATTLTSRDLDGARDALRSAMASPATAEELRARIPERFLKSLGDSGRKAGLPTVAAMVLRHMWVTGEIMRIAADGRLDGTQVRWGIDPRPRTVPTAADAVTVIAARWLAAHGPVTSKAFATAFGIAAGRATAALKAVKPIEVEIEGLPGVHLVPADFVEPSPEPPPPRLVPLRDPLVDVQLAGLASPDAARLAMTRAHGVGPVVIVCGEVVGTWLYDDVSRSIAWRSFAPTPLEGALAEAVDAEAGRMSAFIADQLPSAPLHTVPHARVSRVVPAVAELAIEV